MLDDITVNHFEHYAFCDFCRKHLVIKKREVDYTKSSFKRRQRRKWHEQERYLVTHGEYKDED
jgi:hypothetical protein